MICGTFHAGSGLGNQLHRYVAVRCLSKDKGYEWGMEYPSLFKGSFFKDFDFGKPVTGITLDFQEQKVTNQEGWDIRPYDLRLELVKDNTRIEGEFQDEKYFKHHLDEIREWLKVEPLDIPNDVCIINFRGGEYVGVPSLFLPQYYWDEAIAEMKKDYPDIRFQVHTDDAATARIFFPDYEIIQDMETNWRAIRYAKHLILSNSSFAILPALLNERTLEIIAPKYWAGFNKGYWQLEQNNYERFTYI